MTIVDHYHVCGCKICASDLRKKDIQLEPIVVYFDQQIEVYFGSVFNLGIIHIMTLEGP